MIRLTAVLLATASFCVPALAADFGLAPTPMDTMLVEVPTNWSGFYIGVFGGAAVNPRDAGVIEIDEDLDGDFDEALVGPLGPAFGPNFIGSNDGGFLGGVEAGYDFQVQNFVIGGVIDIARVDYEQRQSGFSATPASYTELSELNYLATLRGRAGYLFTDSVLGYVHGGLAVGDVDYTFVSTNPNGESRGGNDTSVGYQIGAGVEAKVTQNVSLGLEYGYTNLGDTDFTTRFDNGPFAGVNPDGADLRGSDRTFDFHTVKASLKYRF